MRLPVVGLLACCLVVSNCLAVSNVALAQHAPSMPFQYGGPPQPVAVPPALLEQKIAELARLQAEVDALRQATGMVEQIVVRFQALEVSRTAMRAAGIDFAFAGGPQVSGTSTGVDTLLMQSGDRDSVARFVETLKQKDLVKVLAEPNIATLSGRAASIHVGGELPWPVILPDKSVDSRTRKFGTQIDLVATHLGGNKLRVELRPSFSSLDPSHSVTRDGVTVPAIRRVEIETGLVMEFGQTAILGGITQKREATETNGVPYLMDIPLAGPLFRRSSTKVQEVETIVLVTPELVGPTGPSQRPAFHAQAPGASVIR